MKKYINHLLVSSTIFLTACLGQLEKAPYGEALEDDFYKTSEDAISAINAAYTQAQWINDGFFSPMAALDCSSDDVFKGGGHAGDQAGLTELSNYTITTSNTIVGDKWSSAYQGIFKTNKVLEKVPEIEMDETLKNRILGEAYFLRGYFYYDLLIQFGGVIKVDHPLSSEEFNKSRSSRSEIVDFIQEDLDLALGLLPKKSEYDQNNDLGRATKGASLAYLIKLNVMEKKWAEAVQYSEQLFALGEYELEPDFRLIFEPEGEHCKESIWEINFEENSIAGWLKGNPGTWNNIVFMPRSINGTGFCQVTDDLRNAFEDDDPRAESTIYQHESTDYGTSYYSRKYCSTPFSSYPWPSNGASHGGHNYRAVRLSDIYLLYAEAQFHLGNEEQARVYINKVRARARGGKEGILADVTTTGTDLLESIYHERRVELAMEGHRFWDLLRTDRAATILKDKGFIKGIHELRPIPLSEITLGNGRIEQNDGYQ
ncbi:RagB/SusD family nutrient uptake outer membrane protein [Flammeovirga aprica]|uniref:RagB/SusD family nutrient uptake outer membrane protein n=1 Tax=Flammeovirga aprica JL-4 TaxID=694437 RepID=A0A7X9S193_9BACT|nr:RagB/SusD family nutrient uptake outer membrane protein [Flammeovirga aprica]NME72556.1 RagB/SusD family nutrient uptake outer membrane protein [Flammeovirga aprica JL-4]